MRAIGIMVVVCAALSTARADVNADIQGAFTGFVASVAKKQVPKVELFLPPGADDEAVPPDLEELVKQLPKPAVTVSTIVVSPGGKSAWLAGEITAQNTWGKKPKPGKMRGSAVLQLEGTTWRVVATQWSWPKTEGPTNMCGMISDWPVTAKVPAAHAPLRKAVSDALDETKSFAQYRALMSDDKRAVMIGTGPNEKLVGGTKIKKLFTRFRMQGWEADTGFAGSTADGALTWMAVPMIVHKFCVGYRAFLVFHTENGQPRMIHQHYANASDTWPD